jgi:hypothetical protein
MSSGDKGLQRYLLAWRTALYRARSDVAAAFASTVWDIFFSLREIEDGDVMPG